MSESDVVTADVQVVMDAAGPGALAGFWAVALGYRLQDPPPAFGSWPDALRAWGIPEANWDDATALVPITGPGPRIFFQKVPEERSGKNRLHLDIGVGRGVTDPDRRWALIMDRVELLERHGANRVEERRHPGTGDHWMVMTDPEGNEFCVH